MWPILERVDTASTTGVRGSPRRASGREFGMCKSWQNGGDKRTSQVSRRRGQDVIVPCATASDAFSFPTKIGG
jgi:hypothetical protein